MPTGLTQSIRLRATRLSGCSAQHCGLIATRPLCAATPRCRAKSTVSGMTAALAAAVSTAAPAAKPVVPCTDAAEPGPGSLQEHRRKSWDFFRSLGSPELHVAPMVDQSELVFRMLCRENGATAAYTPMLHGRIFSESQKYRDEFFTTCPQDRPLFAQFCGNDAGILLSAASHIQDQCDAIDINFGCPQRIARKGHYGAFLMDNLDHVEKMVTAMAAGLKIPLTCKIRIYPELDRTVAYAQMLERSGCQLLAVHGRTRDQKDARAVRADWDAIKAVRQAIGIPMLANGDIQSLEDARRCMAYTGANGVMSADPLLANPALFSSVPEREQPWAQHPGTRGALLLLRYLDLVDKYETPSRMIRAHMHKMLGDWLQEHVDLRERMTTAIFPNNDDIRPIVRELIARIKSCERDFPIKAVTDRKKLQMKRKAEAVAEQQREDLALAELNAHRPVSATATAASLQPERIAQAA